jgi:Ca-activated chloride channel homolog
MLERAKSDPTKIHALVVMTDGKDESSTHTTIEQLEAMLASDTAPVKIFTIAYGDAADPAILDSIASAAQGTSVKGSTKTIVQIYQDLSAFF